MSMKKLNINVVILSVKVIVRLDFSSGSVIKNLITSRRCKRCGFDPWVGKIPWRRKWQTTPIFLLGKSHGKSGLVGYSRWAHKSQTWLSDQTTERRLIASILLSVLIDLKWLWTCQFITRGLKEIPKNITEYLYKYIMESWFLSTKK